MQEKVMVPAIRFAGFTDAWEQRKFGNVFEEYSEKGHPELSALTIIQGSGTIRRDESDRNLQYDKSSLSSYKLVNADDFIVHLRSFEGGLEKATTLGIISPAYHTFHGEGTDSRFYYAYFRSHQFINKDLKPHVYGIRDGRSIDIDGMKTIDIPYTNIDEQRAIGDFIEHLDHLITLIERDPTRKAIIKGKSPAQKKIKYLNQFELHTLLVNLDLHGDINWDWLILLVSKTGMRFSEALAITPKDFDFSHQSLSISKTWDYKGKGGFLPTKNASSVRKIQIDWQTVIQFSELVKGLPKDEPIFVTKERVFNSTVNNILERHCKRLNIPVISIHGLRHTHASLLLFAGVSIASVARRLGHASMTTTQKTYIHIIQELENQDVDLVMRSLSGLS